jgi:hypothetical protein
MSKGETMMEKMLDFDDEWRKTQGFTSTRDLAKHYFEIARQGMIPADRAIEVGEWPGDAKSLVWQWQYHGAVAGGLNIVDRPTPQWSPQIGGAVFAKGEETVFVGRIAERDPNGESEYPFLVSIGERKSWFRHLKPFRPEAIGLSWGEI